MQITVRNYPCRANFGCGPIVQPFGRYSRKCLNTHTPWLTDWQTRPANYFSPTHQWKSSFIERSMLMHLNVHSLRFWISVQTKPKSHWRTPLCMWWAIYAIGTSDPRVQSLPLPHGGHSPRFLQIRLRHESCDKYVIHISKMAFKKMIFWNAALLCEHYGAAEQVTWLITHPYSVGAPPIGMSQSKWISFQTLNC